MFLWSLISKASFNGAGELPKGVGPLVPAKLPTDTVRYCGDKLSSQTQFGAKLQSKRLWWVLPLWHVPLKLVHQRNVTHVDVKLWNIEDLMHILMQHLLFRASSVSMRINWHQQQTKSKQALSTVLSIFVIIASHIAIATFNTLIAFHTFPNIKQPYIPL